MDCVLRRTVMILVIDIGASSNSDCAKITRKRSTLNEIRHIGVACDEGKAVVLNLLQNVTTEKKLA